ncbi:MAG: ABC transporter ATP-binding protein, partial [Lachnospiraceae bacterium]|nr:ABC transporter ATP-binding protein [Lachnospiraceae bacterium]
ENAIKNVEEKIARLESEIKIADENLNDEKIASNSAKLNEWLTKKNTLEAELMPLYDEWENLTNNL